MSLVRTFLASSGVLSMGPSQDSDRSLSKNIGSAVDGTGKPAQGLKMSDYYESVVDVDNVVQVIDGGNPIAMSDFRNKTGRITEETRNTVINNRNSKIVRFTWVTTYETRRTCAKRGCLGGCEKYRTTRIETGSYRQYYTTYRNTSSTTIQVNKDLNPVKEIIRDFISRLFS